MKTQKVSSKLLNIKTMFSRQNSYNYKFGFTLAEVLVTLGIIGVVSAMTVPTLMQNYQKKSYVTQLHKVYNEIQQASLQYITDRNALNLKEAGLNSNSAAETFVRTYFKVVQECDSMDDCFASADEYKKLTGTTVDGYGRSHKSFVLANGAAIRPIISGDTGAVLNIGVDINGKQGPNILGRDLFWFYLYSDGIIDDYGTSAPLTKEKREENYNNSCNNTSGGAGGCFGKILNDNWEMTY